MENYKKVIDELVKEFSESMENIDENQELVNSFESYLYSIVKIMENTDSKIVGEKNKETIEEILKYCTRDTMELPLEQKKQKLLNDKSFEKIRTLSNDAFEMTQKVLKRELNEINKNEVENMKNKFKQLLENVREFNRSEATLLISEGILDLNFVENPKTEIMSIRLGRCLYNNVKEN